MLLPYCVAKPSTIPVCAHASHGNTSLAGNGPASAVQLVGTHPVPPCVVFFKGGGVAQGPQ